MNLSDLAPTGLRGRILLIVVLTTTVITMLLSWGVLYTWRYRMISQEIDNAQAVGRAFSVAVIDALIYAEQEYYQSESFLDNYVDMFLQENPRLRAITILGPDGAIVSRSWDQRQPPWVSGPLAVILAATRPASTITRTDGHWLLETVFPLTTGERRWGTLVMAVEADSISRQIRQAFVQMMLLATAVSSVLMLLLWLILGRVLGSLHTLVTAMDTLDFNAARIPSLPHRHDEIGSLYQHFHSMQKRLEQSRDELLTVQHQVWHAERLAAIGRLAAGLAHEINNPINGVQNCIYAIRSAPDDREQTLAYLELMDEGLTHATGVIEKLLGFARRQQSDLCAVDVNDALKTVQRLIRFDTDRRGVVLDTDLAGDLPLVMADGQLLQEVFMNLLINAADAMPDGGTIRVTSRHDDRFVILTVADQGHGIDREHRGKIFDPFFTTKQTGKGTGLGLSISLGIVQALGGDITVDSEPGMGARFAVSLPIPRKESST